MADYHAMVVRRIKQATLLVVIGVLAFFLTTCGKQSPRVYRVGVISASDFFLPVVAGFKAEMAQRGYAEGRNIAYDVIKLNRDPEGDLRAAMQFVSSKVDLIYTVPTEPTVMAQAATQGTDIPVVFAYAGIEGSDLVNSVREPGDNITGVRFPGPEVLSKRLEILLELAPSVKRVWIGFDRDYPNSLPALEAMRPVAAAQKVALIEVPVATLAEIEADLAKREAAVDIGLDAMILMPDNLNHSPAGWEVIRRFASKHNVPIGGSFLYTVEQGALFGNANDLYKVGELAASLADKIFKGTPAGAIPVVTPEQDLWINYKVAQDLGLTVPEGLLSMAAQIIH